MRELHLHRLPPGAARRSCRSAATRSAGRSRRPAFKTVTETCYQTVTETACREVCETVCVPRTEVRQVTRECGEWVTQQVCIPGKIICVNGCLDPVPADLLLQAGLVPSDRGRERLLHGL